ncbi:MAG: lysylphosphatidylglycerol synthase transmembrane domain-containing protein [Bacteroidota bacterium]
MNRHLKTGLQLLLGILLAGFLMYYTYQDRSTEELVAVFTQSDRTWIGLGALTLLLVFIFRALRWKLMLDSSGQEVSTGNTLLSVLILYFVNSLTPKLGEIARCTVLYKTDKVPVATSLGTVVSERVIDALVLFGGVGILLLFEFDRLASLFQATIFSGWTTQSTLILIGVLGLLAALGIGTLVYLRKQSGKDGIMGRISQFADTALEAARSIFKLEKPWLFFVHTLIVWALLIFMNYCMVKALPATQEYGWYVAILLLFIGGIGWIFPTPNGMGTTNYIIVQLFLILGMEEKIGQDIGLLSNGLTFIFSLIYGGLALLWFMYLVFRQESLAEKESQ